MRIGILIKDFDELRNFELRILEEILRHPKLELAVLIKDGRANDISIFRKLKSKILNKSFFSKLLFKIQYTIESWIFKTHITVNKNKLIEELGQIETIYVSPSRNGFLDIFDTKDSNNIKDYSLDLILRHDFGIIRGEILNSAKYGIWSFHHGDNAVNRGGPVGFWEIVLKEPYIGVTLQQLTSELDGGLVIDKAFYNWHWSYFKNNHDILEESVTLLFKNINKLLNGTYQVKKSLVYSNPLYKSPNLYYCLKYILRFYYNIFIKALNIISYKIFGIRSSCWKLFISKGLFAEATLFRLKPASLPKDEFWADPFLYQSDNKLYAFFENYDYKQQKGKISVAEVKNNKLCNVQDALVTDYHLSYPFIIEEDGELFMIPETCSNIRVEIYKCIQFPMHWELANTAFDGESIVDTSYFQDDQGDRWLFLNKGYANKAELYIYKIDSLKLNKIIPHHENPVMINTLYARNAGPIFRYDNNWCRPSQYSAYGKYGVGLNINIIKKLSISEYEEELLVTAHANFRKNLIGMHHVHQASHYFIFDACFNKVL